MAIKLCNGTLREYERVTKKHKTVYPYRNAWFVGMNLWTPDGIKRRRLKCPECGRRMMSSVILDEDFDYIHHYIPPHKPKGWWKKSKKKAKKTNNIRRR